MNEQSTSTQSTGKKLDGDKLPVGRAVLAYFPRAIEYVARVSKFGKEKYSVEYEDQNWSKVENADLRYEDAVARHTLAPQRGERNDPESGLLHLGHRAWDALATLELALRADEQAGQPVGAANSSVPAEGLAEPPKACGCKTEGTWPRLTGTICSKHMAEISPVADVPHPAGNNGLDGLSSKRAFKEGDRVRVLSAQHTAPQLTIGHTGVVDRADMSGPDGVKVVFGTPINDYWYYAPEELEHV